MLIRIVAPHFVAGVVTEGGYVARAAPIVGYMRKQRWARKQVLAYCKSKGWKVTVIP